MIFLFAKFKSFYSNHNLWCIDAWCFDLLLLFCVELGYTPSCSSYSRPPCEPANLGVLCTKRDLPNHKNNSTVWTGLTWLMSFGDNVITLTVFFSGWIQVTQMLGPISSCTRDLSFACTWIYSPELVLEHSYLQGKYSAVAVTYTLDPFYFVPLGTHHSWNRTSMEWEICLTVGF